MPAWKTRKRTTLLAHSKFLTVEEHEVELPDGRVIPDWSWVVLPSYTNIVLQTENGDFLCFRQGKYGIEGESLALVGGYIEPDESPFDAAQRELLEETGYSTTDWESLGTYRVDANRGAGMAHLFFAKNARQTGTPIVDDLEEQTLVRFSREQMTQALLAGEFKVLAWTAGLALALLRS